MHKIKTTRLTGWEGVQVVEDVVDALELSRGENDLLGEQRGYNVGVDRLQEVGHAARGRYALGHHASDAVSVRQNPVR